GLSQRGADVTILTTAHPGCGARCASDPQVRHLPGTAPGQWTPAFARAAQQAIATLESSRPFDVFHSESTAARGIKGIGRRLVVNYHGVLHSESPLTATYLRAVGLREAPRTIWRQRSLAAALPGMYRDDRRIIGNAARLVTGSAYTQSLLTRWFPASRRRSSVVYNGVDTVSYHPGRCQRTVGQAPD